MRLLIIPGLPLFALVVSDLMAPLPLVIGLPLLFLVIFLVSCLGLLRLLTGRLPF